MWSKIQLISTNHLDQDTGSCPKRNRKGEQDWLKERISACRGPGAEGRTPSARPTGAVGEFLCRRSLGFARDVIWHWAWHCCRAGRRAGRRACRHQPMCRCALGESRASRASRASASASAVAFFLSWKDVLPATGHRPRGV